jgi:hypothetical protein
MSDKRQACVEALIQAGAEYNDGPVFDILRGRIDLLEKRLKGNPGIVHQHFDVGEGRRYSGGWVYGGNFGGAPLRDTTLLHLCAEFNFMKEAELLLAHGADVNTRAIPMNGIGTQTPIYHAVTSNFNYCYPMVEFLIEHGADLSVRASIRVPRKGKKPLEVLLEDVTPLGYALQYPNYIDGKPWDNVVELLRKHNATE